MNHPSVLLASTLTVVMGFPTAAQADDLSISFDLAAEPAIAPTPSPSTSSPSHQAPVTTAQPIALEFELSTSKVDSVPNPSPSKPTLTVADLPDAPLDALFEGGTDSLVARAVGSAEGTRTAYGNRTSAYYGHVDPGNGVWNLGSFSYQHGARSPEDADLKQLKRLRQQAELLQTKATARGITLGLAEKLNGIDLANQSPRAALDRMGYVDRLAQAYELGLAGDEAVLWARTRAYLDPDSGRWNAPGLGNNVYSITRDQQRRQRAIERAIVAVPIAAVKPDRAISEGEVVDRLLSLDRSTERSPL